MRTRLLNSISNTTTDLLNEFDKVSSICAFLVSFTFVVNRLWGLHLMIFILVVQVLV